MFTSFSNGNGSAIENSLDSGRISSQACLRNVQRQRCWKRGSGDGQRLSLRDYGTTERSFNAVQRLTGEVRRSAPERLQGHRRQPIARSGKFVRRAYSRRALDCEKTTVLCFLLSWSTLCIVLLFEIRGGWGEEGRFDVAARSETPKTSCQSHKQHLLRPRSGPSKAAHTNNRGEEQQVVYITE